jgi:hypothetical protein
VAERARLLIARSRRRLIASAMLRAALGWLAASAAASGLAVGVASAAGAAWAGPVLFSALCAIALASGGLSALTRIPSAARTAAFLDAQLGNGELLSAALHCEGRGMSGRFDRIVVREAEAAAGESAEKGRKFDFGRRRLARLAALAVASVMAGILLSLVPRFPALASGGRNAGNPVENSALSRAEGRGMRASAARSVARSVFPDDSRLTREAEKALEDGRYGDFRSMIEKADADLARRIAKSASALERDRLQKEKKALDEAAAKAMDDVAKENEENGGRKEREDPPPGKRRAGDEGGGGEEEAGGAGQGRKPGTGKEGKGRGEDRQAAARALEAAGDEGRDPSAPDGEAGVGAGESDEGGEGGDKGANALPGEGAGDEPGRGSGPEREFARLKPREKGGKAVKLGGPESDPMEIVMPGKERKAAPGAAAEAIRSAEAALARERLPLEYGDYVREYFLSIAENERGEGE